MSLNNPTKPNFYDILRRKFLLTLSSKRISSGIFTITNVINSHFLKDQKCAASNKKLLCLLNKPNQMED